MKKIILSLTILGLFTSSYAANTAPVTAKATASAAVATSSDDSPITTNVKCDDGSACAVINTTSTSVITAVNKGVPQSQTMSLIQTIIIPQFDFTLMTRYALGNNWKLATH